MSMRTLNKLKMQENIASKSLTILVGDFQPYGCNEISLLQLMLVHMWISHKCKISNLSKSVIGKGKVKPLSYFV